MHDSYLMLKVMFYQIELMIYLLILVNRNKFLLISGKL